MKKYISLILDCYNSEIVVFEMRDNMKKELCIDILSANLKVLFFTAIVEADIQVVHFAILLISEKFI